MTENTCLATGRPSVTLHSPRSSITPRRIQPAVQSSVPVPIRSGVVLSHGLPARRRAVRGVDDARRHHEAIINGGFEVDLQRLKSVADISRLHGREQPNKVALKFNGRETTYRELDEYSNSVANGLLAQGQKPGMRIGFLGKNQDRLWEVIMGSFKSRTACVSVNWRLAAAEISYVLSNAECEVLFVGEHFYHIVEEISPQLPRLKAIIAMDGGHSSWPSADWRAEQSADDPMLQSESDDDVFQLYSSGTTGRPKGVCLTNGNYLWTYRHPLSLGTAGSPPHGRTADNRARRSPAASGRGSPG